MRRSKGDGDDDNNHKTSTVRKRDQRRDRDHDGSGIDSGNLQDNDDHVNRREIRSKYRDLINSVQNREDMLNPSNNMLTEVLEEANKLFKDRQAREAALDAQLLVVATDLGKEKASQLCAEGSSFDPSAFAEHLLSFMGLNRLEDAQNGQQNGGEGYLPDDAWDRVARRAECCFKTAPTFHYLGSFHAEPPPPKQRTERQIRAPNKEAKRIMPTQKMEESQQEATEKEVERILGYLKGYYQEDTAPIPYYEFVIDPNSFSRTVENMFHTSFLIRDGLARMYLDDNRLPCIPAEEGGMEDGASTSRKQGVTSISLKTWK
uniref:Non-structural maintenance of chromosomes element 4 n=1 Tax=Periophthalmus magnuspinnatus TaxID=409849 RepID=A0A3B4BDW7_9GOBI